METLEEPLNKAQLKLLKLFSRVNNEKELSEISDDYLILRKEVIGRN